MTCAWTVTNRQPPGYRPTTNHGCPSHACQPAIRVAYSFSRLPSGWLKMTDIKLEDKIYNFIYRLKIDYITMQCAILFKTTAEYKSQQRSKLYRPPVIERHTGTKTQLYPVSTKISSIWIWRNIKQYRAFYSVNFMPGHFDGPSLSRPSFSAPPCRHWQPVTVKWVSAS